MKPSLRLGVISFVVLIISVFFGWYGFDASMKFAVKKMVSLKPGGMLRDFYMKIPFPLIIKLYVFNVTNPLEVSNGAKPIIQEVGPYVFEERKEKVFVSESEVDDTLTFYSKDTYYFNAEKTGNLTGEESITIPHPIIVSIALLANNLAPALVPMASQAIDSLFDKPRTPFLTTTANEVLINGLIINCTRTDFPSIAVCSQIKSKAKILQQIDKNIFRFSIVGSLNGTTPYKFKVLRGLKNYEDIGRILEVNDKTEMHVWSSKECNQFRGTEGTVFPALLEKTRAITAYVPMACRSLTGRFVGTMTYKKLPVNKYVLDFGDQSTNQADKCFCPTPQTCWKKGVFDLSKCAAPILLSLPHFYGGDESFVRGVEGLHPNQEQHEAMAYLERFVGAPLIVRNRVQFNLPIVPVKKIPSMENMSNTVLPLLWIEEGLDLNSTYTKPIKILHYMLTTVHIGKWIILAISLIGMTFAACRYFKAKKHSNKITFVDTNKTSGNSPKSAHHADVKRANYRPNGEVMTGHEFDRY